MSRLTSLKDLSATTTLFDRQYSYNSANQISQIVEPSQTRAFGYDNVDRLTSTADSVNGNESYTFDAVGNRTASHRSSTYSYQQFNKIASTQTATYRSDANGNMTSKAEGSNFWRYGWDFENRMVSASTRKQSVRYKYDALGRRIQRILGYGRENTKFIYDGLDVVMDDDVNSGITKYQNGLGIDNKLKLSNGGVSKYFVLDHLGSTVALTNSSGVVTEQTFYDSFGNPTNASVSSRYQYTGREFDTFTGLQYSRARWYDPNLGRFISEDPIGFAGKDINLFGYVRNQPLIFRDSRGLFPDGDVLNPNVIRAAGAALSAAGILAPPILVAAGGAALIYGASYVGEYTANHPSNPFVNGPWPLNPFKPPFGEPFPITPPISPTVRPGPACQPMPRAIPWTSWPPIKYPIPLGPYPPLTPEEQEECYQKCQHLLGIGDYGVQFNSCYRRCTGRID